MTQSPATLPPLQRPAVAVLPAHTPPQTAAALAAVAKNQMKTLAANNLRLKAVADRLQLYFNGGVTLGTSDLFHLIFAIARGIDYALSNNDIPEIANRLPSLIKQVCQRQNDPLLRSAIMVLMISVKNACKNRWFLKRDAEELLCMSNELSSSFCMPLSATTFTNPHDIIPRLMIRYYPQLKFCHLVSSLEAKPGYDVLMADFLIPRNIPPNERICLLVAQTDNLEMSSCIISPQHVSFLINGKGVDRRTNVSVDAGPQFPTDITKMLKYGTNIIQAIGYFSGNYIIAIAFMSRITPCAPCLEDYVYPMIEKPVSDSDVIEGSSRISLNCPISFKRIKTPVKGHLCKHHQCFDYDNFMEMNSRKPSWRCPCCNTHTSCIDLRIDQKMVKILREVGEGVADIVIFADGSWKAFDEHNVNINQVHKGSSRQQETNTENNSTLDDVVDLTMEKDCTSDIEKNTEQVIFRRSEDKAEDDISELEDRKPFKDNEGLPIPPHASGASIGSSLMSSQMAAHYTRDSIWPGNMPSFSSSILDRTGCTIPYNAQGTLESLSNNIMTNVTNISQSDVVSPALNRGPVVSQPAVSLMTQLGENMQLQSSRVGGSTISSEAGRCFIPRHVSRTPTAVQALPAQTQSLSSSRRMQSVVTNGLGLATDEMPIDQPSRTSNISSASLQLHSNAQVGIPTLNLISNRAPQGQPGGAGALRPTFSTLEYRYAPQLVYQRRNNSANPPSVSQPSPAPASQVQQAPHNPAHATRNLGTSPSVLLSARHAAQAATLQSGAARFSSISRVASVPTTTETGGALSSSESDGWTELQYDKNWRPTGRMRGSLTGVAYEAALNQYLVSSALPGQSQLPPFLATVSTDQFSALPSDTLNVQAPATQQ
ncbi:E4 SUMO-protein ligase PIAL2-like isoform X1 [Canna indica]|uniref:E4 SUMO-protein ligase PIAL2-like isoform X1 n=1 Tax=Canna indica TaxID=4628 RepID=A0AAQ3K0A5_9LILI|nr:E4 SUMO-protein ligase PIAL2-like isoform X1 [Canna indica]